MEIRPDNIMETKEHKVFLTLNDWWKSLGLSERNWLYYHWKTKYPDNLPNISDVTLDI